MVCCLEVSKFDFKKTPPYNPPQPLHPIFPASIKTQLNFMQNLKFEIKSWILLLLFFIFVAYFFFPKFSC